MRVQEVIDANIKAAITKVTQTVVEKRSLLGIIDQITTNGSVAAKPTPVTIQHTLNKSSVVTPRGSSKSKGPQTSRGATSPEEPEHKRTRLTQPKVVEPTGTPPLSPTPS